jgi:hypothetical protein
MAAYGLDWGQLTLFHVSASPLADGRMMAMFFAVIACSGAFINYSRRSSSILIALGGLELTFISIFFSQPMV